MRRGIVAVLVWAAVRVSPAAAQVQEIPDPQLPEIAMVVPAPDMPGGAVIVYNPVLCAEIGPACAFFRVHEHGHIMLGHQFTDPGRYAMEKERDADRYAATYASARAICAAWLLFLSGGSSRDFRVYGHPLERARRLRSFAIEAGTWHCGR